MKRMTPILYTMFAALLTIIVTGCSSTGYSGGTSHYHRNAWEYDNYYRSGANRHYNRPAVRANVRSGRAARSRRVRSGGGRR
jgi:hypothetical protein